MVGSLLLAVLTLLPHYLSALKYDAEQVKWNLNQNRTATDPLDYWGQWPNHSRYLLVTELSIQLSDRSVPPLPRKLAVPFLYSYAR